MLENDNNVNSENTEVGPQSSIPDDVPSKDTSSQSAPSASSVYYSLAASLAYLR